jgi:dimethylamine/trimethylamine dehydrogenase
MDDGKTPTGDRVLVYDCEGYFMASSLAQRLRRDGYLVELATPLPEIAPLCEETLEAPLLRRHLHEIGVRIHPQVSLTRIDEGRIRGITQFGEPIEFAVDSVVLVTQRLSNDSLYLELTTLHQPGLSESGVRALYRIGDCAAPRVIAEAIFDGHRLGREIDSEAPEIPRPYLRERSELV